MPAATIGRFQIHSELSKTEGGGCYKATDPKNGRTVVLHTTRSEPTPECQKRLQKFREQARAASALGSPNIAAVYSAGDVEGTFLVATEYVEGTSLQARMAMEEMSPSELVDLTRQVGTALDHAQSKGCVHPRLSPAAIMLEWDGTAKVMGFAVAPELEGEAAAQAALPYLAPEQVRGGPATLRASLFSWGAILYELATRKKPFGDEPATVRARIAEETPAAPHEVNPKVPVGISRVIVRALAKEPGERYNSAAELIAEIENYRSAEKAELKPAATATPAPGAMRAPAMPKPAPAAAAPAPAPVRVATPPPASMHAPEPPAAAPGAEAPRPVTAAAAKPAAAAAPAKPAAAASQQKLLLIGGGVILLLLGIVVGLVLTRRSPETAAQPTVASPTAVPAAVQPEIAPTATPAAGTPSAPVSPAAGGRPRKGTKPVAVTPAAPVIPTGELVVVSAPEGAQVQVDGKSEGWVTPHTGAGIPAGQHTVVISKAGYATLTRSVEVPAGGRAFVSASLTELAAKVNVSSEPAGAKVLVNGRDSGKQTPAELVLAKGSYSIAVRKDGFLEESTSVALGPGESTNFSATLKPLGSAESIRAAGGIKKIFGGGKPQDAARLQIKTEPKGARITINSRLMEKNTPAEFYLPPGNYEVVLSLSGYQPVRKVVTAEKGGKINIEEKMQK